LRHIADDVGLAAKISRATDVVRNTPVVEVLGGPTVLFSRSFALGLLAYLRQAALSLHRAPASFGEAMREYYDEHNIPSPARVIARIDATTEADDTTVAKRGRELVARLFGYSITFGEEDLVAVRGSLRALERLLQQEVELDAERIRIRLALSRAEELVRRRLGRRAAQVDKVRHLNETPGLGLRPLSEIAGAGWPE
jgi:hypothetical protein